MVGWGGGQCDFGVTPVPIGLGFWTALGLGLGVRGPDLGLGLDKKILPSSGIRNCSTIPLKSLFQAHFEPLEIFDSEF